MTIDTSKEAVERMLIGVTPGPWQTGQSSWNDDGEVQYTLHGIKHARYADCMFIAAARELVPALTAERDAQTARADAAEAEVSRLTAELTALRAGQDALVAAVCDVAASMIEDNMRHAAELGREIWPIPDIRALTTADATAARDALLRAERNKVRREVAKLYENGAGPGLGGWDYFGDFYDAILAMIETEANNDR